MEQSPRLRPLDPSEFTSEQKALVGDWDKMHFATVTVRHPQMYQVFLPYLARLIRETSLPPRDREVLIIRTLAIADESYEQAHHLNIALNAGLNEPEVAAVKGSGKGLSAFDHLLMRAADELLADYQLSDETWGAIAECYSEVQLMEVVYLVGCYTTMAMLTKTFRIPLEDDADSSFKALRDYT